MLSPAGPVIEKGFYNLIFMALCLEVALTQESYTESQLDQLETAIKKVSSNFLVGCWALPRMFFPLWIAHHQVSWVGSHCVLYPEVWEYS